MTDANGSATQIAADAGTPDPANGDAGQGSDGTPNDPFSGLDTGTREWVGNKGYKSVSDIAQAARNAENLIGRSVRLPGDDAKPEDIDKFVLEATAKYRPDKADGYEFKLPDGVPEDMPYDEDFAGGLKTKAHELGLTARQAAGLHDWYVSVYADGYKATQEANDAKAVEATAALEKTFGGEAGSDAFKAGNALAGRAMDELGGKPLIDTLKAKGMIDEKGYILDPSFASAFYKVGKALFTEDGHEHGNGDATAADNPFLPGPNKGNQTLQMQMIGKDREAAIRLIRAAGHKPEDWNISAAA